MQTASHGWHLKREIQLTHIISTLTFAAAAAGYIVNMDQRLAVIEANMTASMRAQAQRDAQQDDVATKADALIRDQLAKIDAKLDRLIERYAPPQARR